MIMRTITGLAAAIVLGAASHVPAADTAAAQLERFKGLAGDWTTLDGATSVTYRVTAGGSAVVETVFVGKPHEMVTVYTIDKGELVLTHYCAKGNQPHMKAVRGGDPNTIAFKFVSLGNSKSPKDGHMHEATFLFKDADHFSSAWQYYENGKPGERVGLDLARKSG